MFRWIKWAQLNTLRVLPTIEMDLEAANGFIHAKQSKNALLNSSLNWFGCFRDLTLRKEFVRYSMKQKSMYSTIPIVFLISAWVIAETVASLLYNSDQISSEFSFDIASLISVAFELLLYFLLLWCSRLEKVSSAHIFFQVLFISAMHLVFLLKLIKQITVGTKIDCIPTHLSGMITITDTSSASFCASSNSFFSILSLKMLLLMCFSPLLLLVILHEPHLPFLLCNWLLLGGFMLYIASTAIFTFLPILITLLIVLVLFLELHRQRLQSFLHYYQMQQILQDQERTADALHAMELRHMIGNVAHDLKTPLASFTSGMDLIDTIIASTTEDLQDLSSSTSNTTTAVVDCLHSIHTCLQSLRNTNAFMLMTINRCIDYTKASKGIPLVPTYETIDLIEVVSFPIACMMNLQDRIRIELQSLPSEIASYLITDKQWLQENLLCLLSNAVKYSREAGSTVTIQVSWVQHKPVSEFLAPEVAMIPSEAARRVPREQARRQQRRSSSSSSSSSTGPAVTGVHVRYSFFTSTTRSGGEGGASTSSVPMMVNHSSSSTASFPPVVDNNNNNNTITTNTNSGEASGYLLFEIEDRGIGISEEMRKLLFSPFKQAQRLAGGTGLGLYSLAKRTEALKGSYGVQSRKDLQQGSLFWFAIPYRPDDSNNNALLIARSQSLSSRTPFASSQVVSRANESSKDDEDDDPAATMTSTTIERESILLPKKEEAGGVATPTPSSSRMILHVLIVDDAPSIVKMLSMMLKRLGHVVTTAENGEVAIQRVIEYWEQYHQCFDLILMDLQMPVMDGLEATRRLRQMTFPLPRTTTTTSPAAMTTAQEKKKEKSAERITTRTVLLGTDPTEESSKTTQLLATSTPTTIPTPAAAPMTITTTSTTIMQKQTTAGSRKVKSPKGPFLIFGVSANSDHETVAEAMRAGVDEFIAKPFTMDGFHQVLQKYL